MFYRTSDAFYLSTNESYSMSIVYGTTEMTEMTESSILGFLLTGAKIPVYKCSIFYIQLVETIKQGGGSEGVEGFKPPSSLV